MDHLGHSAPPGSEEGDVVVLGDHSATTELNNRMMTDSVETLSSSTAAEGTQLTTSMTSDSNSGINNTSFVSSWSSSLSGMTTTTERSTMSGTTTMTSSSSESPYHPSSQPPHQKSSGGQSPVNIQLRHPDGIPVDISDRDIGDKMDTTEDIEHEIRPGEFVMRRLFEEFSTLADKKITHILATEPLEKPLSKSLQRGEDPTFDQLLTAFGSVAELCLPSILNVLFSWRERQLAASAEAIDRNKLFLPSSNNNTITSMFGLSLMSGSTSNQHTTSSSKASSTPASLSKASAKGTATLLQMAERAEAVFLIEKRDLAVEFLFCLVLIEVLKQLSLHPGNEEATTYIENLAFKNFHFRQSAQLNPNLVNMNIISDLYAEVVGVLVQSRFPSVRKKFMSELHELRIKGEASALVRHDIISLLMGMKFFRVKMFPIEDFEACFSLLHELAQYFLEIRHRDVKHALAGLFVEILDPVAAVVKTEVNVPCLKNFVELLYHPTLDMCTKKKHMLSLFPLMTCLLCVSQKKFFLDNWYNFLTTCILAHLKDRDTKMCRVALESLYRLLWVYMIRVKSPESNAVVSSRLQHIINSLFPKGNKGVIPRDTPLNIFVKIIQFVAHERLDFAMKEIVFDLLNGGRPIKTITTPERMSVGLRAFLVVSDSLQQKDGEPPMPQTFGILPSGNTVRVKKTFLSKMLTDEMARHIGMNQYYPFVRKALGDILKALDAQLGRPFMLTQNVSGKEPGNLFVGGDRKPKIDLFRTCIAAIPRTMPDGMTREELVNLLSRLTLHIDEEMRGLAFQSLQNIVNDFKDWREDVIEGFVKVVQTEVSDSFPELVDNSVRMLLQLLTTWKNCLKESASQSSQAVSPTFHYSHPPVIGESSESEEDQPVHPIAGTPSLLSEESYLFAFLDRLLSSGDERMSNLGKKTLILLMEFNSDVGSLLDSVVDCCFDVKTDLDTMKDGSLMVPINPGSPATRGHDEAILSTNSTFPRSRSAQSLKDQHGQPQHQDQEQLFQLLSSVTDDSINLLTKYFWIAVAILDTDCESDFILALRLLDNILQRLPLDRPDVRNLVDQVYAQLQWSSRMLSAVGDDYDDDEDFDGEDDGEEENGNNFPGLHALLLKGCTSPSTYEPTICLLHRLTPMLGLGIDVIDPVSRSDDNAKSDAFPLTVMSILPYMLSNFDNPPPLCLAVAECFAEWASSERSPVGKIDNLATVMTLYRRRMFNKEPFQWAKCVVKYLYDVYPHVFPSIMDYLVDVMDRHGSTPIGTNTLSIIYYILHYIDVNSPNITLNHNLSKVILKHLEGGNFPTWKDWALKSIKLVVSRSSSFSSAPPSRPPSLTPMLAALISGGSTSGGDIGASLSSLVSLSSFPATRTSTCSSIELPGRTMDFSCDTNFPICGKEFLSDKNSSDDEGPEDEGPTILDALSDDDMTDNDPQTMVIREERIAKAQDLFVTKRHDNINASQIQRKRWRLTHRGRMNREKLISLLASFEERVGLPKSPSVVSILSQASESGGRIPGVTSVSSGGERGRNIPFEENIPSVTSSTEDLSAAGKDVGVSKEIKDKDKEDIISIEPTEDDMEGVAPEFVVFKDFDFLDEEGEGLDNFNWGVRRIGSTLDGTGIAEEDGLEDVYSRSPFHGDQEASSLQIDSQLDSLQIHDTVAEEEGDKDDHRRRSISKEGDVSISSDDEERSHSTSPFDDSVGDAPPEGTPAVISSEDRHGASPNILELPQNLSLPRHYRVQRREERKEEEAELDVGKEQTSHHERRRSN